LKKDLGLNTIFGASSVLYAIAGLILLGVYRFFLTRDMARARAAEVQPVKLPAHDAAQGSVAACRT